MKKFINGDLAYFSKPSGIIKKINVDFIIKLYSYPHVDYGDVYIAYLYPDETEYFISEEDYNFLINIEKN